MTEFRPPKALGGMVFVVPDVVDTDGEGNQIDITSGLYYGREVDLPTGLIVSIGPDARKLMRTSDGNGGERFAQIGDRIIFERDKAAEMEYSGQTINMLKADADCAYCGRRLLNDSILGIQSNE